MKNVVLNVQNFIITHEIFQKTNNGLHKVN